MFSRRVKAAWATMQSMVAERVTNGATALAKAFPLGSR